jgi:hypothetical protein
VERLARDKGVLGVCRDDLRVSVQRESPLKLLTRLGLPQPQSLIPTLPSLNSAYAQMPVELPEQLLPEPGRPKVIHGLLQGTHAKGARFNSQAHAIAASTWKHPGG